jgi:hypothetical protein
MIDVAEVYERYARDVYRFALYLSGNRALAEDIASETFARAWIARDRQFAVLFSCFAFGRIVSDTSWDVSPRNFIITASIAGCFWIVYGVSIWRLRRRFFRARRTRN